MKHAIATLAATTASDVELVAAPGSGVQIVIFGIYVSSDVQQQIDFESDATVNQLLHRQFVAANGGQIPSFRTGESADEKNNALWKVPINQALTYTTSASGNVVVEVWYDIGSR